MFHIFSDPSPFLIISEFASIIVLPSAETTKMVSKNKTVFWTPFSLYEHWNTDLQKFRAQGSLNLTPLWRASSTDCLLLPWTSKSPFQLFFGEQTEQASSSLYMMMVGSLFGFMGCSSLASPSQISDGW